MPETTDEFQRNVVGQIVNSVRQQVAGFIAQPNVPGPSNDYMLRRPYNPGDIIYAPDGEVVGIVTEVRHNANDYGYGGVSYVIRTAQSQLGVRDITIDADDMNQIEARIMGRFSAQTHQVRPLAEANQTTLPVRRRANIAMTPEVLAKFLNLPKDHEVTYCEFNSSRNQINLVIQGPGCPIVEEGCVAPYISLTDLHIWEANQPDPEKLKVKPRDWIQTQLKEESQQKSCNSKPNEL